MEQIIDMVRRMVIFLFLAVVISNLFAGSEYRKYLSYATSLITVLLVLLPVLQLFGKDNEWEDYFVNSSYEQKMIETKSEIERLGKQYEETIQEQYEVSVREEIAACFGVPVENCRLQTDGQKVESIYVKVKEMPEKVTTYRTSLTVRYGVSEENIFIEEG